MRLQQSRPLPRAALVAMTLLVATILLRPSHRKSPQQTQAPRLEPPPPIRLGARPIHSHRRRRHQRPRQLPRRQHQRLRQILFRRRRHRRFRTHLGRRRTPSHKPAPLLRLDHRVPLLVRPRIPSVVRQSLHSMPRRPRVLGRQRRTRLGIRPQSPLGNLGGPTKRSEARPRIRLGRRFNPVPTILSARRRRPNLRTRLGHRFSPVQATRSEEARLRMTPSIAPQG